MATDIELRCHYRAVFTVEALDERGDSWREVLQTTRAWIKDKEKLDRTTPGFWGSWFYTGGSWEPHTAASTRCLVRTAHAEAAATNSEVWALEYEHPDSDFPSRRWRTSVGTERLSNGVLVSAALSHWVKPGYVGVEPPAPSPSAPRFVASLLRSRSFLVKGGSGLRLSDGVYQLPVGEGHLLRNWILDPARKVPIVFVTRLFGRTDFALDPAPLARALAGSAAIVAAASSVVDKETEQLLPRMYRCWGGRVRIYFPGVDPSHPTDYRKHRFFEPDDVQALTEPEVHSQIVRSVHRWILGNSGNVVSGLADVEGRRSRARLVELSERLEKGSESERWVKECLQPELDKNGRRIAELEATCRRLEDESLELEAAAHASNVAQRSAERRLDEFKGYLATMERRLEAAGFHDHVPKTLSDAVDLIGKLFDDRVVITEKARRSAKAAAINDHGSAMKHVWRLLWAVANDLHELFFSWPESKNVAALFAERTKFEYAPTEGGQTKNDAKLLKQREVEFRGRAVAAIGHVKYGRPPQQLRIYVYPDPETRLIVIGQCGDHLDTAGTRRLR